MSVTKAINALSSPVVDTIRKIWEDFNVKQLDSLLSRFMSFLCSPIVRNCHVLFASNTEFDGKHLKRLMSLAKILNIELPLLQDELSVLNTTHETYSSLSELFHSHELKFTLLSRLIEGVLVICPHNMNVEKGFSEMKGCESVYQNQMKLATYDSLRIIKAFYDRDTFEKVELTPSLMKSMKSAASSYTKESKELKSKNQKRKLEAEKVREEFGIYKRHTSMQLKQQEIKIDAEIKANEERIIALKRRRTLLNAEKAGTTELNDRVSNSIINSWMPSTSH